MDGNRYNLMAQGMLLFLVLPPSSANPALDASITTQSRKCIAGILHDFNHMVRSLGVLTRASKFENLFQLNEHLLSLTAIIGCRWIHK